MTSKKILLVQYYTVKSENDAYRSNRQEEVNKCLLLNVKNRFLDEIHLLTEELFALDFIPEELKHKIKQVVIHKRLDYSTAFEYYTTNIPNTICILANADIFTDESIEVLDHIEFDRSILALNRYEFDSDEKATLLSGLEINRNFPALFPNYGPSIWSQDAWVWKASSINIPGVDFLLGSWGCDIRIAYFLRQAGYIIYNPSFLISINHYDRMSATVNEDGILKGQISSLRDPPSDDYKEKRLFLTNECDIIDRYTTDSRLVEATRCGQTITNLSLQKSIHALFCEIQNKDNENYIEYDFTKLCNVHILDTTGKPCSHTDYTIGHVSKMRISYYINDCWIDYPDTLNGQTHSVGNFIKRNYLTPFQCSKCRIYCLETVGIPTLNATFYGL